LAVEDEARIVNIETPIIVDKRSCVTGLLNESQGIWVVGLGGRQEGPRRPNHILVSLPCFLPSYLSLFIIVSDKREALDLTVFFSERLRVLEMAENLEI
jgi:hypothetical protein